MAIGIIILLHFVNVKITQKKFLLGNEIKNEGGDEDDGDVSNFWILEMENYGIVE